jgi:hypothetical protein
MSRITIVFPHDGGEPYVKGTRQQSTEVHGTTIMPDLPDFVSPIDGKEYRGRAGLREHCKIHDVVPNAELKGLPTLQSNSDFRSQSEKRTDAAERKRLVIQEVTKHYR